jgi:colanic acid/amylovoran biosynthesis glycosyltransferase
MLIGIHQSVGGIPASQLGEHYLLENEAGAVKILLLKATGQSGHLQRRLARLNPVLIHAHFATNALDISRISGNLGVPLVVTAHGFDITTPDSEFMLSPYGARYLLGRRTLQSQACLFIAVSEFIRRKMIERGYPPDKIAVHYTGVPVPATELDAADRKRGQVVSCVCRLIERKGCHHLIDAMKIVQQARPEVMLNIVGDGPERRSLEARAIRSQVRCRFFGELPQSEALKILAHSDVFCMPSFDEGFGMVYLEAQSLGVPVVAFDNPPMREVIVNNETGLLALDRDVAGLARHMHDLLSNETVRLEFGRRGRERVRSRFDIERQSKRLEEIYECVLADWRKRSINQRRVG